MKTKKLSATEKKIRIRTGKRTAYKVKNKIPQSKIGLNILKSILFIEKYFYRT